MPGYLHILHRTAACSYTHSTLVGTFVRWNEIQQWAAGENLLLEPLLPTAGLKRARRNIGWAAERVVVSEHGMALASKGTLEVAPDSHIAVVDRAVWVAGEVH